MTAETMTRQERRAAARRAAKGQREPTRWSPPVPLTSEQAAEQRRRSAEAMRTVAMLAALAVPP